MKKAFIKLSSVVLALALVLGCLTTAYAETTETSTEAPAELDIWDGTVATSFAGGSGTEDDPYIIATPEQLARMLDTFGDSKYYELANDIYLNDVTADDWYTATTNKEWFIGCMPQNNNYKYYNTDASKSNFFYGNIDGNGHTVYGLWYSDTTTSMYSGLIPSAKSAEIKNLAIDKAYIVATTNAAGFVGANGRGGVGGTISFESCFAGENVYVESLSDGAVAGFVGQLQGRSDGTHQTYIENCYSLIPEENLVNTSDSSYMKNVFIGLPWETVFKVSNSYCIGSPFYADRSERVSTLAADGYSNVYATATAAKLDVGYYTTVAAENMQGNAAVTNMPNLGNKFVTVNGGYPTLKAFVFGTDIDIWGGFITKPADKDENGEYEIYTAEELAWYVANGGKAKLMNDIYLNDMKVTVSNGTASMTKLTDETAPLSAGDSSLREWYGEGTSLKEVNEDGALSYTFNGNGYAVNGLYYNKLSSSESTARRYGLFNNIGGSGEIKGTADIKGLGIENCYMLTGNKYSAACIIGYVNYAYYTISECYLAESVYHESGTQYVGGIVGGGNMPSDGSKPAITDCISLATLKHAGTTDNNRDAIAHYWDKNNKMSVTRCLVANGYKAYSQASATDVYHNIADNSTIQGANALAAAPNLDKTKVYAVKADGKFPMLRVRGTTIGDVNEDGVGLAAGDDEALRKALIGTAEALNGNFNKDDDTDILDLVALTLAKKNNF